jgi:hypothetical protein
MRIFEGVGDAHSSSHLGTSAFPRLRARIRGGTTPRLTVVVAVLACVVGSGLWRVAPSEARARNGLIAYSQETDQCDNRQRVRLVRAYGGAAGARTPQDALFD